MNAITLKLGVADKLAMLRDRKNQKALATAAVVAIGLGASMAFAGTDTTFDSIVAMLQNWLEGSLGKVLALAGFAIALGAGLVRGSATGVIFGVAIALCAVYGPGILTALFSGTF
ncbi:TraA family conjugative transfer protein [Cupriavidus malaysiensis]|uniref:Conjugal transfer protein TraA n=1 Tax=Cupriavidus malaysiensis TaxID=367825 RepID=A0ABM6FGV9_9BURK|nr:TraA family conjugative transfer protein [Cupriavidus malaysiensis]AOZ11198.1 hypothetical protein BKK80_35180 [Cupriavidus malaysiensis]